MYTLPNADYASLKDMPRVSQAQADVNVKRIEQDIIKVGIISTAGRATVSIVGLSTTLMFGQQIFVLRHKMQMDCVLGG